MFGEQRSGTAENNDPFDHDYVADFSKTEGDKIDLSALNLTDTEFTAILRGATSKVDASKVRVTLDLTNDMEGADVDGGKITVMMSEAFATLDADDFII